MILVLDYGLGNVHSIAAKFVQMGEEVQISSSIESIEAADRIILPGVGNFGTGAKNLSNLEICDLLRRRIIHEKVPILGICLGMHLLTQRSEEGNGDGLGLIEGETKRFRFENNIFPLPHMGWNEVRIRNNSPLFDSIPDNSRFYFVHSFHPICVVCSDVIATTNYGYDFSSVIGRDLVWGVQFHPEKSHKQGKQLMKNFARL